MKQKLMDIVEARIESEIKANFIHSRSPLKYLADLPVSAIIDAASGVLYLYTRVKPSQHKAIGFSEVITAIGNDIRKMVTSKRNSSTAAKTGAFVLYAYEYLGLIKLVKGAGKNGHGTFHIEVLDDDAICNLWSALPTNKVEKLPALEPYAPWTSGVHETGARMVKTYDPSYEKMLLPETHPIVFETINRAQKVGWRINEDVFRIYSWALRNKTEAFADIWEMQNPEAKASKVREAKAIGAIAQKLIDKTFYHLYYLDFRGRKYPATAYLHEQGTDLSKGLLLRADKLAMGEQGFFWLCISIATNWAGSAGREDGAKTDKIPLNDRVYWTLDNEEILLSYAENPKVNTGWMQADAPWQFLAACMEFRKFREWQKGLKAVCEDELEFEDKKYDYESSIECYIDGSNNGSQHLSALTRDEVTAPHVNLVPQELPGDLYKYIADDVWANLKIIIDKIPDDKRKRLESIIDTLTDMKKQIHQAEQRSERRKELITAIIEWKKEHADDITEAAPVFWWRISDNKHRRKVVKRNVMTLPYGGTPYGLGQQQIDDARKHGIDLLNTMEHKWGSYMGRMVYEVCKSSLRRPMQLLSVFESAGRAAEERKEFLEWIVPVTEFPVVQHYVEGKVKRIWVQYEPPIGVPNEKGNYPNALHATICCPEDPKISPNKQAQGAAPNIIHSLDAAHLMMTVHACNFPVTTIHDSYGSLLGHMPELFCVVREQFVKLYAQDPLNDIAAQIGGDLSNVEIGTLDVSLIEDSEYAFC